MKLIKRLKNLWKLSEYRIINNSITKDINPWSIKDFPIVEKKLAKIIEDVKNIDFFEEKKQND